MRVIYVEAIDARKEESMILRNEIQLRLRVSPSMAMQANLNSLNSKSLMRPPWAVHASKCLGLLVCLHGCLLFPWRPSCLRFIGCSGMAPQFCGDFCVWNPPNWFGKRKAVPNLGLNLSGLVSTAQSRHTLLYNQAGRQRVSIIFAHISPLSPSLCYFSLHLHHAYRC